MPLTMHNIISLPVPSQPEARHPWDLPARAANSPLGSNLPAPPMPRIKSNFFFSFFWCKMHSGTHAFTLLVVVLLRYLKPGQTQMSV